jgi:DNA polymerase-3 subunit delta'
VRFSDIPGLADTKKKLVEAVKRSHIAHAQLFAGNEGSAALPLALAFATYLNCEKPGDDACGECAQCQKNAKFIHPDVNFIFPTAATQKLARDKASSDKFLKEWRTFLATKPYGSLNDWSAHYGWENKLLSIPTHEKTAIGQALSLKAFEGKFKIMIIWLPELMHQNTANGILKILEEPPANTIFLMVSNAPDRLLTTITSRTQKLHVDNFSDQEIQSYLISAQDQSSEAAERIAYFAEGNLRKALTLTEGFEDDTQEVFKDWFRQCYSFNFENLVNMADAFQKKGKEFQLELLKATSRIIREAMIARVPVAALSRMPASEESFMQKFSAVFSEDKVMLIAPKIDEAHYHIERNANPKILFLDLSLFIAQIART